MDISWARRVDAYKIGYDVTPSSPFRPTVNPFIDFGTDIRFALRMLRKAPLTSAMIVLFLGFSVGAVGTVFAWTESIVFQPLPAVRDIDEIASLRTDVPGRDVYVSYPAFLDARAADSASPAPAFTGIAGSGIRRFSFRTDLRAETRRAEPVWGALATANYFDVLRVGMRLGPGFRPRDDLSRGGAAVAVVSHALWQRRFGADTAIIGRHVWLNNREVEVVGVAAEGFAGGISRLALDIWIPITLQPEVVGGRDLLDRRDARWLDVFGRRRAGVSLDEARRHTETIGRSLSSRFAEDRDMLLTARLFDVGPVQRMKPLFAVMLGIAALVVLIVCSNVANLLLLRGAAREHELAVRVALGAQPDRVVRQLMTESFLLAIGGVVAGMGFLAWARNALDSLTPASPLPIVASTPVDWTVLTVLALTGIGTTFVFGLAPATRAAKAAVRSGLAGGGSTRGGSAGTGALRGALLSLQFALSLAVLVTAGLFMRRLDELQRADLGFRDSARVLLATVDFDLSGVHGDSTRHFITEQLIDGVQALPGAVSATAATFVPLGFLGYSSGETTVDGYAPARGEDMTFLFNAVGGDYFSTLGIPILQGRPIDRSDRAGTQPVAVVNEAFAARFFGTTNPVGRRIHLRQWEFIVAGVAANGKYEYTAPLDEPSPPFIYVPLMQWGVSTIVLHVRTNGDALALMPAVHRVAAATDPNLLVMAPSTLESYSSVPFLPIRLGSRILGVLGAGALILATLGLYAVIGFAVEQQKREIGIRMALGASRSTLMIHFLAHAGRYAVVGSVTGVGLALGIAWVLSTRLPGSVPRVTSSMLLPFAVAILLLVVVSAVAAMVPAARAARVDPTAALREE